MVNCPVCGKLLISSVPCNHDVMLAPISHIEMQQFPESYVSTRGGVLAYVSIPPQDVDNMNLMAQTVVILQTLAFKMNNFTACSESTRKCIRECRSLAIILQEEIEVRRGK